jgi:hypothetical protein
MKLHMGGQTLAKAVNGVVKMAGIATTTLLMVQQDLFMG